MSAIRVLLADDHGVFLDGLRAILSVAPDMEVVAEAMDGHEAVDLATKKSPDVVVMDLGMPELNGVEATRRIAHMGPSTAVLVLTMYEDDEALFAALRAGARGYVLKGAASQDVVAAIRAVAEGEAVFGKGVADRVLNFFRQQRDLSPKAFPGLTDREREVLGLLADGLSNQNIARRLQLNQKTVRNHVSNVFAKLHVAERADAASQARAAGLGSSKRWGPQ
jgi:DNA-binding NarL/FixJ family response regulator